MAAFRTTQWRWISGILGILCLLLMTLLGILLNKSHSNQSIKPTASPELQKGYSDCCYSCLEGWIGYQCRCYLFSIEQKSWEASRKFCESKNSSLLQMHSENELVPIPDFVSKQDFIRRSRYFYWIGVSYDKDRGAWLWLNGSVVSHDLFKQQTFNTNKCITYKPSEGFLDESCEEENSYICKQELN